MIKRSTWLLLVILILALGAYLLLKYRPIKKGAEPTPTAIGNDFLVSEATGKLQSIRIDGHFKSVSIARDNNGLWRISLPSSGVADQALAEAAETQVGALRIVTRLETAPQLSAVGLEIPADTIRLDFTNGVVHILEIGILTPTGSGYYVRRDGSDVFVVSQSGVESLLNLLDNPPYAATTTPVPTLTPTRASDTATP